MISPAASTIATAAILFDTTHMEFGSVFYKYHKIIFPT